MKPLLSICIPTIVGREKQYNALRQYVEKQAEPFGSLIEIISICDNKEISIGTKRQRMYQRCRGKYAWQIDDDDSIHENAVEMIMDALKSSPDCVGFKEWCVFEDRNETSSFSMHWSRWDDNVGCFDHVRTPFCKTPIRTELCLKAGVKDMRYGEDHQFAKDVHKLLRTEVFIDEFIYIYRYKFEPHNTKYGIK